MLSIIIVNYKTSGEIDFCLKSIMRFEPHYRDYEFIIIDNNSNDSELKNLKEKYPFVKIIYAPRNGGFAYGNNLGIKASQGEYILLLNPDTYIENNSIEKLYVKLKNSKDIFFAGPQLLNPDRSIQSYSGPKSYLTLWRLFCERLYLPRIFKRVHIFRNILCILKSLIIVYRLLEKE
ncbi:glycosyltransferase [Candidatus Desantisbacteria bacterium]|nr:glycosyltransferase [Candidatus Desantisbacteria bacterium]